MAVASTVDAIKVRGRGQDQFQVAMGTDFSEPILIGCKPVFGRNRFQTREIGPHRVTVRIG
jgi:hypothetical protein